MQDPIEVRVRKAVYRRRYQQLRKAGKSRNAARRGARRFVIECCGPAEPG